MARALSAELEANAELMQSILDEPDRSRTPGYFVPRFMVFNAIAGRLGEFEPDQIRRITSTYSLLDLVAKVPGLSEARFETALGLDLHSRVHRGPNLRAAEDEVASWYAKIPDLIAMCRETAKSIDRKSSQKSLPNRKTSAPVK